MASGNCRSLAETPSQIVELLDEVRSAVLVTSAPDATPRPVPVCFAVRGSELVTAVDDKPKSGRPLARIDDIRRTGRAVLLVARWDEDWTRLAWMRIEASARLDGPGSADTVLVPRYPQYAEAPPRGEVIALVPERISWWAWA